jgi:hypothetical protein
MFGGEPALGRAGGVAGFHNAGVERSAPHAEFAQDDFQRAKVGERRLEQIEADECGHPQPMGTVVVCEHKTDEDECSGEAAYYAFHVVDLVDG